MSYVLFFFAGFGFGYAAPGRWKFTPLIFPILLAIGAFLRDGVSGGALLKFVIAVVLIVIGIVLGAIVDQRSARSQTA